MLKGGGGIDLYSGLSKTNPKKVRPTPHLTSKPGSATVLAS